MKYPYNRSAWSGFRVVLDIFILVVYAFLAFAAKEPPKVIMGLAVVFALYAVDGCTRIAEWRDTKVSKPWLSAIFSCLLLSVAWFVHQGRFGPTTAVIASGLLVVAFRPIRQWLGYPRLLIAGVDVDGVLGEQIPALLSRVQTRKHIGMGLSKENITDWAFSFDGTDIAREMEEALLDETFVSEMPVVEGAAFALNVLHEHFHIVVATSRPIVSQRKTVEWLKKNFRFHEVANTRETGKAVLGLEVLIDDNIDNVRSFVAAGGMALLFDQPWNRSAETEQDLQQFFDDKRLVRCTTWTTVVSVLEEFRTNGKLAVKDEESSALVKPAHRRA
jgi:5'(3')-deoxyribonucleotidase